MWCVLVYILFFNGSAGFPKVSSICSLVSWICSGSHEFLMENYQIPGKHDCLHYRNQVILKTVKCSSIWSLTWRLWQLASTTSLARSAPTPKAWFEGPNSLLKTFFPSPQGLLSDRIAFSSFLQVYESANTVFGITKAEPSQNMRCAMCMHVSSHDDL